jgi:hypothetical protein
LLGAIVLEALDLLVDCRKQRVVPRDPRGAVYELNEDWPIPGVASPLITLACSMRASEPTMPVGCLNESRQGLKTCGSGRRHLLYLAFSFSRSR